MPKDKLIEIIDFAVRNSVKIISFSGGEFFTHPNAYEVLEYCFSKKIHTRILTNAKDLDIDFFAKRIKANDFSFQVSIDGLKVNHDRRRGEGSFDATINNVKKLAEAGIRITAKVTLDENNYQDIVDIIKIPYFDDFSILPVVLVNEDNLRETINSDYEATIKLIYREQESGKHSQKGRCINCMTAIAIKYNGDAFPCPECREHNIFCIGNILERSLESILGDMDDDLYNNITRHANMDIVECNSCESKDICDRGCRVRAYKYYGKFLAPDPFCCKVFKNKHKGEVVGNLFFGKKLKQVGKHEKSKHNTNY